MNQTVHHASLIRIALVIVMTAGIAALCWHLAASGYLAAAEFTRRLRLLNEVPPDIRTFGAYFLAGFLLVAALSVGRFLFDTRLVLIDDESIEVRYPFWSKRAYWQTLQR